MKGLTTRVRGLFRRYRLANDVVHGLTCKITDHRKAEIGVVTAVTCNRRFLKCEGRIFADKITARWGEESSSVSRVEGLNGDRPLAFHLSLPLPEGTDHIQPPHLIWEDGTQSGELALRFPPQVITDIKVLAGFCIDLVKVLPSLWGWWRTHDPSFRGRVKRGLRLDRNDQFQPLKTSALALSRDTKPIVDTPVTIILPVHNGLELLKECLRRVTANTDVPWHLILIEDASTDENVRPFLTDWANRDHSMAASPGRVTLLLAERNLGFPNAVNWGLSEAGAAEGTPPGTPVILLNSDALVPQGWASRLIGPLTDPSVASVTPMSNDAEITTAPVICAPTQLATERAVDHIDNTARTLPGHLVRAEMPTGVGFCMALAPSFLARVPRLDTTFGRGYGEEVDWCQRTRALGGRHLGIGNLFVEHKGGSSFGSQEKARLIEANGRLISQRYPSYDAEVAHFLANDPLATPRLVLAVAWAAAHRNRAPVYLAHSMGGGAEFWLRDTIGKDLSRGLPSLVLRIGGPMRWQLEVHAPSGIVGGMCDDFDAVRTLLSLLSERHIIYSCGVGDPDPVALPELLSSLVGPNDRLDVLFHDWFPVSPSYTLLDSDGWYRGPVTAARTNAAHKSRRPNGQTVPLPDWQDAWRSLLDKAGTVRVFSPDGAAQITTTWPDFDPERITVQGHDIDHLENLGQVTAMSPRTHRVLAVLGNLNRQKGDKVIEALSRMFRTTGSTTRIVVLGQTDPAYPLPDAVHVHGGYSFDEIPALIASYGITAWIMPSIWPETFSFSVHEALATGLDVFAFDIGAQGHAVRKAPNGTAIPFDPGTNPAQAMFDAIQLKTND